MKRILFALAAMILAAPAGAANVGYCGGLHSSYGPFDYRMRAKLAEQLDVVERVHFTPNVENGIKGNTGLIGGDLNYTLAVWPNHHRALTTLAQLALRTRAVELQGMKYPVECFFDRALRFAPDDASVHAIYASYLYGTGRQSKGDRETATALALEPDNAIINYNAGLAFFKQKKYDQALACAHKAYALGVPLPGLKKKLVEAGKWTDAPAASATPPGAEPRTSGSAAPAPAAVPTQSPPAAGAGQQ